MRRDPFMIGGYNEIKRRTPDDVSRALCAKLFGCSSIGVNDAFMLIDCDAFWGGLSEPLEDIIDGLACRRVAKSVASSQS